MVRNLLDSAQDSQNQSIHLNPNDLVFLEQERGETLAELKAHGIECLEDSAISRGVCRIDTSDYFLE